MRTFVKGTNIKVTEAMKSYAEERLQRLARYEHFLKDVSLVYSVQRAWHIAEVTLTSATRFCAPKSVRTTCTSPLTRR